MKLNWRDDWPLLAIVILLVVAVFGCAPVVHKPTKTETLMPGVCISYYEHSDSIVAITTPKGELITVWAKHITREPLEVERIGERTGENVMTLKRNP